MPFFRWLDKILLYFSSNLSLLLILPHVALVFPHLYVLMLNYFYIFIFCLAPFIPFSNLLHLHLFYIVWFPLLFPASFMAETLSLYSMKILWFYFFVFFFFIFDFFYYFSFYFFEFQSFLLLLLFIPWSLFCFLNSFMHFYQFLLCFLSFYILFLTSLSSLPLDKSFTNSFFYVYTLFEYSVISFPIFSSASSSWSNVYIFQFSLLQNSDVILPLYLCSYFYYYNMGFLLFSLSFPIRIIFITRSLAVCSKFLSFVIRISYYFREVLYWTYQKYFKISLKQKKNIQ